MLKAAIVMNGPCFGALPVYSDYCDFWINRGQGLQGYHAISIVGYNENGFIIRNSWGKGFCEDGYTVIPYDEFNKLIEIWTVMSLNKMGEFSPIFFVFIKIILYISQKIINEYFNNR